MTTLQTYPIALNQRLHQWWERHQQHLIQIAIIGVVLIASVLLGVKASLLTLIGLFALGSVLIFIKQPALALLLSVLGGFSVPFSGPSGLNITMLGVALLLILWILEMVVRRRSVRIVSIETARPALWLVVVSILAFGVGQLAWYQTLHAPMGAQLGGLFIIILSVGAFLVVCNQVKSLFWIQLLTWVFLAFSSLHIIGWIAPTLGRYVNPLFQYGTTMSLFWLWVVSLSFSQAFFNHKLHPIIRGMLGMLAILTIFVAYHYLNDWKSGWVPPVVSIGAMFGLLSPRLGVVMMLASSYPAPRLLSDVIGTDQYSYGTRLDAWKIVLEIAKVNPILGLGPANYHWYTPLFPIRGYAVKFNSHSQYVDLIAQTGILGLACFVWFVWVMGRLCWRLSRRAPEGFARAYVYGAFGGLVGTVAASALGDWVLPFFYNVGMNGFRSSVLSWIFLGGLVVIDQVLGQEKDA